MAGQQDSQASSRYSFWAGNPSGTKTSSPRVTKSKFSYFVGNKEQKELKTAQTEKKEITKKNPQPAGVCQRAWEAFMDTEHRLMARQKNRSCRTGRKKPISSLPMSKGTSLFNLSHPSSSKLSLFEGAALL